MMTHKLFPSFGDSGFKEHRLIFDAEKAEPVPAVAKDAEKKETAEKTPDAKAAKRIGAAEKDMEKVRAELNANLDTQLDTIEEQLHKRLGHKEASELTDKLAGEKMGDTEKDHINHELHMRELEKLANAPVNTWGQIPSYGKTDGAHIYMYNFDTEAQKLFAYSPVGLQALDAKTGVWQFVPPANRHPPAVVSEYEAKMGTERTKKGLNYDDGAKKFSYDMNTVLEENFLKRDDAHAVSFSDFNKAHPEAWDKAANQEVRDRFLLGSTGKDFVEPVEAAPAEGKKEEPKNAEAKPTEFDGNALKVNFDMPEGTATDLKDKVIEPVTGVRMWGQGKNVLLRFDTAGWNTNEDAPTLGKGTVIKEQLGGKTVYRVMDEGKISGVLEVGTDEIKVIEYKEGGEPKQPLVIPKIK